MDEIGGDDAEGIDPIFCVGYGVRGGACLDEGGVCISCMSGLSEGSGEDAEGIGFQLCIVDGINGSAGQGELAGLGESDGKSAKGISRKPIPIGYNCVRSGAGMGEGSGGV